MGELIAELERLTFELMDRIDIADDQELIRFVEQRQFILNQILLLSSKVIIQGEYKNRIEKILLHDSKITSRMYEIKIFAAHELSKVSNGRMQKSGYEAEYQTADGIFFDRKK
jgi:hypothetical protein